MLEIFITILITLLSLSYIFYPLLANKSDIKKIDWDI